MSHLKKFSYPDITRRKLIIFLTFITFCTLTVIISPLTIQLQKIFQYNDISKYMIAASMLSLFLGSSLGKYLYKKFTASKRMTVFFSFLYFLSFTAGLFFIYNLKADYPLVKLYSNHFYITTAVILLLPLLTGILNSYFLKISTGDFIDDKSLIVPYTFSIFSAIAAGIIFSIHFQDYFEEFISVSLLSALSALIPLLSLFLKNLDFNPNPLFAQHYIDEESDNNIVIKVRDDLLFTYINFSLILIYLFLGFSLFIQEYGNTLENLFFYISTALSTLAISLLASVVFRLKYWHIFSEVLYPISYLLSFYIIQFNSSSLSPFSMIMILNIPCLIYGFSLNQTLNNIMQRFDHEKRFNICDFSFYILPVPILIILPFIPFSYFAFYGLLYAVMFFNLLIPGMFIFNMAKNLRKKITYTIIVMLLIPSIVFGHSFFKISITREYFIRNVENFETLRKVNYNTPYISSNEVIKYKRKPIFHISDSRIQNLKRAVSVGLLYSNESSEILAIDSNQKFFQNPVYNAFDKFRCIDNIPESKIDYKRLPVSGQTKYEAVNTGILSFLKKNQRVYDIIIDNPNIIDQNSEFRFCYDYLNIIKKNIKKNGIYIKIIDLNYQSSSKIKQSLIKTGKLFKHNISFMFCNYLVVASSDNIESLKLNSISVSNVSKLIENNKIGFIYYDPIQILNYILFTDIDTASPFFSSPDRSKKLTSIVYNPIPEQLTEYYMAYEPEWYGMLLSKDKQNTDFNKSIRSFFKKDMEILKLFKKTDFYESNSDYELETAALFKIKKIANYKPALRSYINKILSLKETHYHNKALQYEKKKDWDNAEKLYKAILAIDKDNFNANYKLGILYLTIQQFENAFKYINKALQLNKNHPNVLYQMGVLMFSDNKPDLAISYLEKAYSHKEKHAQLFMYLGLSYMKKERFLKAEECFKKAKLEDPNDNKIENLLKETQENIKSKNTYIHPDKRTSMLDDEKDEEIGLPINKKALRSRLSDEGK